MKAKTKRISTILLIVVLVMSMMLTGCSKSTSGTLTIVEHYNYDLSEYVQVADYLGIEYEAIDVEVTDEEMQSEIDTILQTYSTQTELSEGTIEDGDYVKLSYSLEMDGEEIDSVSAEDYIIQVGQGQLLEEIDEALIGHDVGDTFDVEVTFPEDYSIEESFAGQVGIFTITIESKYLVTYPDYDDDFAAKYLGYDTIEEYEEALWQSLYDEKYYDAKYEQGEIIWEQIVEASVVLQYPEDEVNAMIDSLLETFDLLCETYGIEYDEALESMELEEEEFLESMEESAKTIVKEQMILFYIARENVLEFSDDELRDWLETLMEGYGIDADEFEETYGMDFGEYAEENSVIISLLYQDVFYFLVDEGVAV